MEFILTYIGFVASISNNTCICMFSRFLALFLKFDQDTRQLNFQTEIPSISGGKNYPKILHNLMLTVKLLTSKWAFPPNDYTKGGYLSKLSIYSVMKLVAWKVHEGVNLEQSNFHTIASWGPPLCIWVLVKKTQNLNWLSWLIVVYWNRQITFILSLLKNEYSCVRDQGATAASTQDT